MPELDWIVEEFKNSDAAERKKIVQMLHDIISKSEAEGAGVAA